MDLQKDNKKSLVNSGDLDKFSGGSFPAYLFKKAEKLTSAIYILTDFFSEAEPMKWRLRDKNLFLLSVLSDYIQGEGADQKSVAERLSSAMSEILSLLEIGRMGKIISEMNYEVLREEYVKMAKSIKEEGSLLFVGRMSFDPSFFEFNKYSSSGDASEIIGTRLSAPEMKDLYKGHYKGQDNIKDSDNLSFINKNKFIESYKRQEKRVSGGDNYKSKENPQRVDKSSRTELIMKIIKAKGEVSVRDVSDVIKDCSEKTLQRELISMSKNGLLLKKGDRRWSRYSILKNS